MTTVSLSSVNKDLPIPLSYQLEDALRRAIEAGKWKPGERLPNKTRPAERESFDGVSLNGLLQSKFGVEAATRRCSTSPPASPCSPRIATSRAGRPFEFVRSVMRGDRYRIVLNLVK